MNKKYKLAVSPNAEVRDEDGTPVKTIEEIRRQYFPTLREVHEARRAQDAADLKISLSRIYAHQEKCKNDAVDFLKMYRIQHGNAHIDLEEIEDWLTKNEPLDRWFFIHLIEVAGTMGFEVGMSLHKAEIASRKNAEARAWVLEAWSNRTDTKQSKNAFGRQYAKLVKSKYDLNLTAETIARDWLPKPQK